MKIIKERTRLIITEYTDNEKQRIENMVSTMDKSFLVKDEEKNRLYLATGLEKDIDEMFKNQIIDNSNSYWNYEMITKSEKMFEPRNQLQSDAIDFVLKNTSNNIGLILGPGIGKGNPNFTKIPTPTGYKLMGDLKINDRIFGSDGNVINVEQIFELGVVDIYKVSFNDGRYSLCTEDHLWQVSTFDRNIPIVKSTKEMIHDFKVVREKKKYEFDNGISNRDPYVYKYHIPSLSAPVHYDHQSIPIHPYVLGAFIGNGCCRDTQLTISSGNNFVPNKIASILGFETIPPKSGYSYRFRKDNKLVKSRDFFKDIPSMIKCYSRDKKIPNEYLYNSFNVRMELLRGLMDSDGSISKDYRHGVSYSSCSKILLDQITHLIRGLGFNTSFHEDNRHEKYNGGFHGVIHFKVPNKFKRELFTEPSKLIKAEEAYNTPQKEYYDHLIIKNIELVSKAKSRCIRVSAKDHLYLTQDFIVTHNTFMASYCAMKVGLRTLIVVPTTGIRAQWVESLIEMIGVDSKNITEITNPSQFVNVKSDFVVILQATLNAINRNYDLEKIMYNNKFGIKIIDEAHMYFGNTLKIDAASNIKNNWYLTATFGRSSEDENDLYQRMFSNIKIFKIADKKPTIFNRKPGDEYGLLPHMNVFMYWTSSGLTQEEIKSVMTSKRYNEKEHKWIRYGISVPKYTSLVIPPDNVTPFIKRVLTIIKKANEIPYGRMLVLTPTISSVDTLAKHIKQIIPNKKVGTLHGSNSKSINDTNKAESDILVSTTSSAGTGFDMKDLSTLVVVSPFKSGILTTQVAGRLRRRPDNKETYCYWVVAQDILQLRRWGMLNAEYLKRVSKKFKVIDL